jgi:predicted methyltransferase
MAKLDSRAVKFFDNLLMDIFNLKSPVKVVLVRAVKFDGDGCYAAYFGTKYSRKSFNHRVLISRKMIKDYEALFAAMAHEYIHAWQMEHNKRLTHSDGSGFKPWVRYFRNEWNLNVILMMSIN